uniref:Nas2_N domain-containing protein n=1 Tax=Trichuris muris TaxID=70415 RepID=A0A5S6Q9F1_TRIMR
MSQSPQGKTCSGVEEIKKKVDELMNRRDEILDEIKENTNVLSEMHVRMGESLVDEDDYPRTDVDIVAARTAMHNVACLTNDARALEEEIKLGLEDYFAEQRKVMAMKKLEDATVAAQERDTMDDGEVDRASEAFAVVTKVQPNSCGERAGFLKHDKLVQIGNITASTFQGLRQISLYIEDNRQNEIPAVIQRDGRQFCMKLGPELWGDDGALGLWIASLKFCTP